MPEFEGQYAPYIWAVYALALIMVTGMVLGAGLKARKARREHEKMTQLKADVK